MTGLILLLVAIILPTLFCMGVHFIVAPTVKHLYYKYEPLMFHYVFKYHCRNRKVKEKLLLSYLKIKYFLLVFVMKK